MTIEDTLISIHTELKKIFDLLNQGNRGAWTKTKEEIECPKLIPVSKWSEYQKIPTKGAIKGLVLNRKDNGFDKCLVRISGRHYIDRELYAEWVEEQNEGKNNPDYIKERLDEKAKKRLMRRL